MGSVRARSDNGNLFIDFRFRGVRCRELTSLSDTQEHRRRLTQLLTKLEKEIQQGTFVYRRYFPNSKLARQFDQVIETATSAVVPSLPIAVNRSTRDSPLFKDFAETWFKEFEVAWRNSYKRTVRDILDCHLLPKFGAVCVGHIQRADILQFRSDLAKARGKQRGSTLSPARLNTVMLILRQSLNEAADRFEFVTPFIRIKPLKVPRSDVNPFTLDEVRQIIDTVRADYRNYYTVRFFTGMRTGEIDGLKWRYVDFERRLILVRETVVGGKEEYTKTDGSQREIQLSDVVYQALLAQRSATASLSAFVFCNGQGNTLEHNNVTKRVWYPLLRHLGLKLRKPYQTRHTAATLWLAAGENPEWIARQLGHTSTEMLFTTYSRFVPNLTRKDGSAFERLLAGTLTTSIAQGAPHG